MAVTGMGETAGALSAMACCGRSRCRFGRPRRRGPHRLGTHHGILQHGDDANARGLQPDQRHLYVNTTSDLFTVNPYTGDFGTDVTDTPANNLLPGGLTGTTYDNVAMRPDGELYTFDSNGNYDQLNTGNAQTFVTTQSNGITCYQLDPSNEHGHTGVINGPADNVVFNAMTDGPRANGQWPVYAVGSQSSGNDGTVPFTTNLLYQFNEDPSVDKINVVNYPQDPATCHGWGPTSRRWPV